jgi:hypothetical protein
MLVPKVFIAVGSYTVITIIVVVIIHAATLTTSADGAAVHPDDVIAIALFSIMLVSAYAIPMWRDVLHSINLRPSAGISRHKGQFALHFINAVIEGVQWLVLFLHCARTNTPMYPEQEEVAYQVLLLVPFDPSGSIGVGLALVAVYYATSWGIHWATQKQPSSPLEYWTEDEAPPVESALLPISINGALASPILLSGLQALRIVEHPYHIMATMYFVFIWTGGYSIPASVHSTTWDPAQTTVPFQRLRGAVKLAYFLLVWLPLAGSQRITYGVTVQSIIASTLQGVLMAAVILLKPSPMHIINATYFIMHGVGMSLALSHLPHSDTESQAVNQRVFFYLLLSAILATGFMYIFRVYFRSRVPRSTQNAVTGLRVLAMRADVRVTDEYSQRCRRPVEGLLALCCSPLEADRTLATQLLHSKSTGGFEESRTQKSYDETLFTETTLLTLALSVGHLLKVPGQLELHLLRIVVSLLRCTGYSHVMHQSVVIAWHVTQKWSPEDIADTNGVRKHWRHLVERDSLDLNIILLRTTCRQLRKRNVVRCWMGTLLSLCYMDMDLMVRHTSLWSEILNIGAVARAFKCTGQFVELLHRIHMYTVARCLGKEDDLEAYDRNMLEVLRAREVDETLKGIETGPDIDDACRTFVRQMIDERNIHNSQMGPTE